MQLNTSDRREQKKFGLVMVSAFGLLGLLRWVLHHFESLPWLLWGIALVFLALGLAAPRALGPVFKLWMKFALAINWIMTRVFLALAFYVILTPTRILIRFFGEDPLHRAWKAPSESYWEAPEDQPRDMERFRQQF